MAQRVPVSPQRSAKLRCSTRQLGSALDAHRQPHRSRPHAKAVSSLLATQEGSRRCTNIKWQEGAVERAAKEHLLKQKGCCLWFTGLSGSGKSTVACTLEHALLQRGHLTSLLDGDNIRCDTWALRLGIMRWTGSGDHISRSHGRATANKHMPCPAAYCKYHQCAHGAGLVPQSRSSARHTVSQPGLPL